MFKTAVIMAGGRGTRMFPVSDYVPKPLIKINGTPLIDHCIDNLRKEGVDNIYVTYGYKSDLLVSHIEKKVNGLINTIDKDNAWFLYNSVIKYIDEPIIIIPCDIIMSFELNEIKNLCDIQSKYHSTYKDHIYILPTEYKTGMKADFLKTYVNNQIIKIGRNEESSICASGFQLLNPKHINNMSKNLIVYNWYDVWNIAIKNSNLFALNTFAKNWSTYDNLEQLLKTN